ncbi:malto-oligosyltrehalose trehalohydrolase [Geomonas sp. RF6]|uniref:malto-oligosyltrehalose trehalohydrolase n=1 Tax=Geomonas sp. RF6 TaxID=2897342 RepID=UPI001E5CB2F9|nr:malto-oligosyltrehalose trehalohydrolase [Geomonas sp. RF6]UFS70574.1 malto-oligosyltrehalose trehalohydrolase [Geomonas sp. RF6]
MSIQKRRLPVGAEPMPEGGVHFRVWAPRRKKVEVVLLGRGVHAAAEQVVMELDPEDGGYYSGLCHEARIGSLYRFRLDDGDSFPDPASRFQPEGPHGPSCVVDPYFQWSDQVWAGPKLEEQVMYEMHIGTYTPEGNWHGAAQQLPELARLGITTVEVMPVAEFPGEFGWGYDGVDLFAPTRLYGFPDDFRRFVDTAHSLGLSIILDVVYNHLGPEGNYLREYSPHYFTDRYTNEWGDSVDFDGEHSGPVREFFIANAVYWISEFHLDGLRLDATQVIFDNSPKHILACISEAAREVAGERSLLLVAENEPQHVRCLRPIADGGYGLDLMWNDDFHHSARVALTGYNEAYYSEYLGTPQELVSAVKWSYLYQGQYYYWQGKRRGSPTFSFSPRRFVHFLENHDQVANSAWGWRVHSLTSPGSFRAMTTLLLLGPQTPLLFQGQEFGACTPFLYFADLSPELAKLVRKGRVDFLRQFTNITSPDVIDALDNPSAPETFLRSRLNLSDREKNVKTYNMHKDLIRLRKEDQVFSRAHTGKVEGAILGPQGFLLRFFVKGDQRLLLVNLGRDLRLSPVPEPLLAPPEDCRWQVLWSSEWSEYGGSGTPELDTDKFWRIQGHAAVVLKPVAAGEQ